MEGDSYFFCETASHHGGDIDFLLSLIDSTVQAQVDGVKFQILTDFDSFISRKHSSYSVLKKYILSNQDWQSAIDLPSLGDLILL